MKLEKSPIELLTDEMDQMGLQSKAFKAMVWIILYRIKK
jgi:hypothetical protein